MVSTTPVGFIGLGTMGRPMAMNLLKAGFEVIASDIDERALSPLVEAGARPAASIRDLAARSNTVITMLPSVKAVEEVALGSEGLLSACGSGSTIIDMSTVGPSTSMRIAKAARAKGIETLDAPVSGGAKGAAAGSLSIMVGGDKSIFDKCLPILSAMGTKTYYAGPSGAGVTVKLVNNLLLGTNMVAVAEALVLGVTAGVDPKLLVEIVQSSSGRSYAFESKVPAFVLPRKFEPGFAIDLQYKDLDLALEAGKELGVPLPLASLAQQVYQMAKAEGLGKDDISAVVKVLEGMAGHEVRGE